VSFSEKLDRENLPAHIAVIMDGNGRWAKGMGRLRVFGHRNGVQAVRETMEGCVEIGIRYLTLYAFSSENWSRPKSEVKALMQILANSLAKEKRTFMNNGIRLNTIGNTADLPKNCREKLAETIELTRHNSVCTLTLALSYSARAEIAEAARSIVRQVMDGHLAPADICEKTIADNLFTADLPDPDLMIRTGGEQRISNYLLYQMAYTEFCFTEKMWPEFDREDLFKAIYEYQQRERRFGKTSEQL